MSASVAPVNYATILTVEFQLLEGSPLLREILQLLPTIDRDSQVTS